MDGETQVPLRSKEKSSGIHQIALGVFLISLSLLMFEITLTRIFSVILTYHYAFIAISVALSGLGSGALFLQILRKMLKLEIRILGLLSILLPLTITLGILILLKAPFDRSFLTYYLAAFVPFFLGGNIFALVFDQFTIHSSKLYSADLLGASIGCLIAILALEIFGGINAALLAGILSALAAIPLAQEKKLVMASIVLYLAISFLFIQNQSSIDIGNGDPQKLLFQADNPSPSNRVIKTYWSAYARTDLVEVENIPEGKVIITDGSAETVMYKFDGNLQNISNLRSTSIYFPYLLSKIENVMVIGPGGGKDVLVALLGGAKNITAVEVNKDIVRIVRENEAYNGGIYDREDVNIVVDEGRSFIKRSSQKYDAIMLTLVYTQASREMVGYSLVENYVFTKEAFKDYIDHLSENGTIIAGVHNEAELLKLIAIAISALNDRGMSTQEAVRHIASVESTKEHMPVFILKKSSFSLNETTEMHEKAHEFGFMPIYIPYLHESEIFSILSSGKITLAEWISGIYPIDVSPTTDDRPFFYNYNQKGPPARLLSLLFAISILSALVIFTPMRYPKWFYQNKNPSNEPRFEKFSIFYFSGLGIGFMMIEIAFIQKFILFLGQPTLSITVILFSLLLATGAGSLLSALVKKERWRQSIAIVSLLTAALIVLYIFILPSIFEQTLRQDLLIRSVISALLIFPLGILLGVPFPIGLKIVKELSEESIAWMWGINGAASVLGSVLGVVIAMLFGFSAVLALGALCYLSLAWCLKYIM